MCCFRSCDSHVTEFVFNFFEMQSTTDLNELVQIFLVQTLSQEELHLKYIAPASVVSIYLLFSTITLSSHFTHAVKR